MQAVTLTQEILLAVPPDLAGGGMHDSRRK